MSMPETFTVKVGEATPAAGGRPSAGPVYRSIYAKDGLMELPQDIQSPWDFFRFGSVSWQATTCY
jgi:long-chain acyl-CoA synthetase